MTDIYDEKRMKIFADAETVNGAVVTRSILPFHETAQNPPILLETALQRFPEQQLDSPYPLVLYIARVAGSKNIILSNFKPGHHSVTRTDVESSLYFVQQLENDAPLFTPDWPGNLMPPNRDSFSNDRPRSSAQLSRHSGSPAFGQSINPAIHNAVASSALPPTPQITTGAPDLADHPMFRQEQMPCAIPPSPTLQQHSLPPPPPVIRRKPVNPDMEARRQSVLSAMGLPPPAPPHLTEQADEKPAVSSYLQKVIDDGARKRAAEGRTLAPQLTPPTFPRTSMGSRPSSGVYSNGTPVSSWAAPGTLPTPSPTPPNASRLSGLPLNINIQGTVPLPSPVAMSLRVVRWHHSSGQTWPVSQLVSAPLPVKDGRRRSISNIPQDVPPIRMVMENPGYAPFADDPSVVFEQKGTAGLPMLVRDVEMAYEKSWTKRLFQHKSKRSEGVNTPKSPVKSHSRAQSIVDEDINLAAGPGLKKEGYTFLTPWGTRCHFKTGKGGGSLICYHSVPVYTHNSHNSHSAHGLHKRNQSSASCHGQPVEKDSRPQFRDIPVSELRFNLPGKSLFGNNGSSSHSPSGSHNLFNFSSGSSEQSDPMWLGKEKAGGGRHGDNAKMGKLIILEGGRDMIDLIVSANIGIWWRTWEVVH